MFLLVPDVDGDGVPEHVVTSWEWDPEAVAVPNVRAALSGASGRELWRQEFTPHGFALGQVALFGDVELDGVPVLLSRRGENELELLSVRSGASLARLEFAEEANAMPAGDVDGDGSVDVILGLDDDRHGVDSGCVRLYSVWDGERGAVRKAPLLLREILGKALQDKLGMRVGSLGDVDGDGRADVYASEHWASDRGFQTGRVRAFSGATGAELYAILGDVPLGKFGHQVQIVGDLDGDGHRDIGVPSMRSGRNGRYSGSFSIFSARTGARLLTIDGPRPGAGFGFGLADARDVNADGTPDLICAALWPGDEAELDIPSDEDLLGTVYVLSGRPIR
jgi:hypothetical protein